MVALVRAHVLRRALLYVHPLVQQAVGRAAFRHVRGAAQFPACGQSIVVFQEHVQI
jgi:hypothetical protein